MISDDSFEGEVYLSTPRLIRMVFQRSDAQQNKHKLAHTYGPSSTNLVAWLLERLAHQAEACLFAQQLLLKVRNNVLA